MCSVLLRFFRYYLRYLDSENEKVACNPKKAAGTKGEVFRIELFQLGLMVVNQSPLALV